MIIGGILITPILERLHDLHIDYYMGGGCGCRGDYEITNKGCELLESLR